MSCTGYGVHVISVISQALVALICLLGLMFGDPGAQSRATFLMCIGLQKVIDIDSRLLDF